MGRIEGVVTALAGWNSRLEVVDVTYDPEVVDYAALVEAAQSMRCTSAVFAHDEEQLAVARELVGDRARELEDPSRVIANSESDQFYQLRRTPMIHLPLTLSQATRLNADASEPESVLSPRQLELLARITAAKLTGDAEALSEMVFPADAAELGPYAASLEAVLAEIEAR